MKKSGKIRIDFGAVDSSLTKLSRHFICKCTSHLPEQLREIMNTFTAQYGRLDVFDAARSSDAGGRRRTLSRPSLIFKNSKLPDESIEDSTLPCFNLQQFQDGIAHFC